MIDFNYSTNMASHKVGTIFCVEVVKHRRFVHWLCGITRNCEYVSQFSLVTYLIASSFSYVVCFHYCSSCLTFGRSPGTHSLTRLAPWRFSFTASTIILFSPTTIIVAHYTYFNRESESVSIIYLWESSTFGMSSFLPSSDSCQVINSETFFVDFFVFKPHINYLFCQFITSLTIRIYLEDFLEKYFFLLH